jgi:trk system potassium uptake protein TrkH
MALLTISGSIIVIGLFVLVLTEEGDFLDLLFEAASAFGTVGLSQGASGELSEAGRAVICFLMFVGRVGPLTLGFFLATKTPPRLRYPSSPIFLG